jgi:hypothetical protein
MIETKDSKGRTIYYNDGDFAFERVFDDLWDDEISAEVIEYSGGARIYERHYNTVTFDIHRPYPYHAGIRPNQVKNGGLHQIE